MGSPSVRNQVALHLRTRMVADSKKDTEFFEEASGGADSLSRDQLVALLSGMSPSADAVVAELLRCSDMDLALPISKDQFLNLIRVNYTVVSAALMCAEVSVKASGQKPSRRLEEGDSLE